MMSGYSTNKPPLTPPPRSQPPLSPSALVSYSSPPSPRNYASTSQRRSSICTPTQLPQAPPHRRTRSFRDPKTQLSPRRNNNNAGTSSASAFDFEMTAQRQKRRTMMTMLGGSNSSGSTTSTATTSGGGGRVLERTSSSSSSVSTATTFFNTSTESATSGCGGGGGGGGGVVLPPVSSSSRGHHGRLSSTASNWSVSSEYSTTSSKRECVAKVQAAGGKLAYLASRRGSIGSNCSSVCSTPPNTPGIINLRGRRQSSGNFLEVPLNQSLMLQQQQQPLEPLVQSSSSKSTPATSPSSRPRVNSLPATSLFASPHLLSPTYYMAQQYSSSSSTSHQGTPYNPRSTITKSQDYLYRLRTFNITKQGDVVNCGDTFVRKSKSNNCIAGNQPSTNNTTTNQDSSTSPRKFSLSTSPTRSQRSIQCRRGSLSPRLVVSYPLLDASCCVSRDSTTGDSSEELSDADDDVDEDVEDEDDNDEFEDELTMREFYDQGPRYRVVLLGESGVGKSALVRQFMTSEYINTYDMSLDEEYGEKEVSVLLDSKESQLVFIDHPCVEMSVENSLSTYQPHACVVVYSVTDKRSFEFASEIVRYLWQEGSTKEKSVILVGNKCDLARARVISSEDGKKLATSHDTKFIETSSGIQHNVDELLVGVLKQIRLREDAFPPPPIPLPIINNNEQLHTNTNIFAHHQHAQEQYHQLVNISANNNNNNGSSSSSSNRSRRRRRMGRTPRGSFINMFFTRELINKLCFINKKAKSCENLHVL